MRALTDHHNSVKKITRSQCRKAYSCQNPERESGRLLFQCSVARIMVQFPESHKNAHSLLRSPAATKSSSGRKELCFNRITNSRVLMLRTDYAAHGELKARSNPTNFGRCCLTVNRFAGVNREYKPNKYYFSRSAITFGILPQYFFVVKERKPNPISRCEISYTFSRRAGCI
jgi:hypothetical protein